MPASLRRRLFRQSSGVNRKLSSIRWIGNVTVGVIRISGSGPCHVKADEGAEKSFSKKRKRRRGQRIGKSRSRGRQPRSYPRNPAPADKQPSNRVIGSHLRACDHWYDRQEQFLELFKGSHLYTECMKHSKRMFLPLYLESYRAWRVRWNKLRNRITPYGEGVVWCSRIGPSFSYWLEQRLGIIVSYHSYSRPPVEPTTARKTLLDWAETLRIRKDDFTRGRPANIRRRHHVNPLLKHSIDNEPQQLIINKRTVCSHCKRSAFAWNQHSCKQRWDKVVRSGKRT